MNEQQLKQALGTPADEAVIGSRREVERWFAQTAPLICWDIVQSPLGPLYLAAGDQGLSSLAFGVSQADFVRQLDPLARTERDPAALAAIAAQLQEYFSGARWQFDFELDLSRSTPFQQRVLQSASRIPWGAVWTYGQVARAIGKPRASRAVGQALGRNPIPIVIPCHRVVAGDGGLGGYSGGGGLESKKWLLRREGAL
jgi:methylated-DNA-[protein]-cysteine S-methyltransferase